MADKIFFDLQHRNQGVKVLSFSFAPQGTSQPTFVAADGRGVATIVRNSAGNFTITLEDAYPRLLSLQSTLAIVSATDIMLQWGAIDVVIAKTLVIRAVVAAVETDIAANAANRIYVDLALRNTSIV